MNKNKKKGLIAGIIILLCLTALSLFIIIFVPSQAKQYNETNTIEHHATVLEVIEKEKRYEIRSEEYPAPLSVAKKTNPNKANILALQSGDKITFRIPDFYDNLLNDGRIEGVLIVSLHTENTSIITLEGLNSSYKEAFKGSVTTGAVFSGLFFTGAIICLVFLIKNKKLTQMNVMSIREILNLYKTAKRGGCFQPPFSLSLTATATRW